MTFKGETYEAIVNSGHTREDVMFVGSLDGKYRINMDEFDKLSDFEYDEGYGAAEIAIDLIVYFNDKSYMARGEYDGKEWWEYMQPLDYNPNDEYKQFTEMGGPNVMWKTVEELITSKIE